MTYRLGVDLGTTFTAAAVTRGAGRPEPVALGARAAVVPSVLYVAENGEFLYGEAAERRAVSDPDRVLRQFKRRIGDETPIVVGDTEFFAHDLGARMITWIVAQVAEREGGPAEAVTVTHPAAWGAHKRELLRSGLDGHGLAEARLVTEPQAAAVSYTGTGRMKPGSTLAVYDLGGGTFDAAVLRARSGEGFELIGRPQGLSDVGGVDFDDAILNHVLDGLGEDVSGLDATDPVVLTALARLRRECVDAKEALSADTAATIPVLLGDVRTNLRITRGEFEAMIAPAVEGTIGALEDALESAGVDAEDLTAVLLTGGSSRIPLVTQRISQDLGLQVAVDMDPNMAVAMGAAMAPASSGTSLAKSGAATGAAAAAGAATMGAAAAGAATVGAAAAGSGDRADAEDDTTRLPQVPAAASSPATVGEAAAGATVPGSRKPSPSADTLPGGIPAVGASPAGSGAAGSAAAESWAAGSGVAGSGAAGDAAGSGFGAGAAPPPRPSTDDDAVVDLDATADVPSSRSRLGARRAFTLFGLTSALLLGSTAGLAGFVEISDQFGSSQSREFDPGDRAEPPGNAQQLKIAAKPDADGDGVPDAKDSTPRGPDTDGDGVPDLDDATPRGPDTDGDGVPDIDDVEPRGPDTDGDGIPDRDDNTPLGPDTDGDGYPDVRDTDIDNDGIPNAKDPRPKVRDTSTGGGNTGGGNTGGGNTGGGKTGGGKTGGGSDTGSGGSDTGSGGSDTGSGGSDTGSSGSTGDGSGSTGDGSGSTGDGSGSTGDGSIPASGPPSPSPTPTPTPSPTPRPTPTATPSPTPTS